MREKQLLKKIFVTVMSAFVLLCPRLSTAQSNEELKNQISELESRVRYLEDFVAELNTHMTTLSQDLRTTLGEFEKGVQDGLDQYSKELNNSVDQRLQAQNDEVVALNLADKGYRKVVTNSGLFLLSLQDVQRMDNGYRLGIHVGNPNFANYQGVTLKLTWGQKWDPNSIIPYNKWRNSLATANFVYDGPLNSGTWTEVLVNIIPAKINELEYIECSLDVGSIQLNLKKPAEKR
jgi:uncharacterized coiled-coil protein SlyX